MGLYEFMFGGGEKVEDDLEETQKGMGYGELILDNVIGLDNEYDSFGEKLGRTINEDEIGFVKQAGQGIYEGAKDFIKAPIETTKEAVKEVATSTKDLFTKDLDERLQEMYGVDMTSATGEQITAAREGVMSDALGASALIPAAGVGIKGVKTLASVLPDVEFDPNTLGMNMGNVKFNQKTIADSELNEETLDTLNEELMSVEAYKAAGMGANGGPPNKTVKGYKLFRINRETGELFPLYVDANNSIPVGDWVPAISGDLSKSGKVKSSIGELAYRPGFHAAQLPWVNHIGSKFPISKDQYDKLKADGANNLLQENTKDGVKYFERLRDEDTVWAEVEMPDDVDWQSEANAKARIKKDGTIEAKTAHITDELPVGGHYLYNTKAGNPNQWIIAGSMKVNRILDDAEVDAINQEAGVLGSDMPRTPYSQPQKVPATVAQQTDSAFDLPTPTTPREGPPEPYVMDGAKIAAELDNTVSAQEVATGVKKPSGAKFSGLTAQQSTLLPNHYSEGLKSTQTIKPVKINWEALEGKTVFSVVGDPTSANTVTKVQGDKLITPVESQAGVEFMDKQDYGYASAQQAMASTHNEIVRAMDEDGADPLLMYLQMAEVSGDFADHTGMLIGELFKQARISSNAIPAIDEHIRKIGMDKKVPKLDSNGEKIWDAKNEQWKTESERIRPFSDFKSVADPLYMARYIAELPTGALRAGLIKGLDRHGLQQKGVPNVGDVRLALMNPDLFGKDWLSAGERLIIPDVDRGLFPTPEGLHNTYDTTIGKVGQSMKVDSDGIPMNLILQDMSEAQRAKGSGGRLIPTSADYKVAEMSPRRSQQKIDARIVDLAMSFEEMSEKYGRGAALSFAQDLLLNEKITSETIKAAKKANAKPWVLSLMAGVMATQAIMEGEDGLMSPTEEEI